VATLSKIGSGRHITYFQPKEFLDETVAVLLGLHAGDGYISCGTWGLRCNIQDKNMAQRILQLIRDVLGVEPNVGIWNNAFEIRSGQRQVVEFFKNYGFINGKKAYSVQIPSQIISSDNPEIVKGFLRGIFSSDGSFSFQKRDHRPRIDLTIRSKFLRDQFIELANRMQFSFNECDPIRNEGGFTDNSNGKFFNANLTSEGAVIKWMRTVGTICDTHIKKYNSWKAS
jgi:hypothetical protein